MCWVLCGSDFVHWVTDGANDVDEVRQPSCSYQVKGRLLTGEEAVISRVGPGELSPARGAVYAGRPAHDSLPPAHGHCQRLATGDREPARQPVRQYMTSDVVTAGPHTPLAKLARTMLDVHIHRVIVVDEQHRPIGIVSSTDLVAALAHADGPMDAAFA